MPIKYFFKFDLENVSFSKYLWNIKRSIMFEFDQYLGFLAFLTILTIGFWLMIFLLTFVVPYWLFGNIRELLKERREKKKAARQA